MGSPLPGVPGAALSAGVLHVLGIRHHGPGSARAVRTALDQLKPDAVVIEGAPELDAVAPLAASRHMVPPVAALVYVPDTPQNATFYPMAAFSPEWVALRWALRRGRPVRFGDLPAANFLAERRASGRATRAAAALDPIATMASAMGYDDPERWWEDAVEHRHQGLDAFVALNQVIAALRAAHPAGLPSDPDDPSSDGDFPIGTGGTGASDGDDLADDGRHVGQISSGDWENACREAAMRRVLRQVVADHDRVAMICGAWHGPALEQAAWPTAAADTRLLRGLPKVKVAATWVPWTASRLATASGYGAGVSSPGWYAHLFEATDDPVARWLVSTATLLRQERLAVSPDSVAEATRLAIALATLRGRPHAGLAECLDATQTVLCGGSQVPLDLVRRRLVVGDDIGAVPDDTPMVPLARDLAATQRRLRLRPAGGVVTLELDLRNPLHRERSSLLHRLRLLGIDWGEPSDSGRTTGSFKETWTLSWEPEMDVTLIEASGTGTTVAGAAAAAVAVAAADAPIDKLCTLISSALVADLPEPVTVLIDTLSQRAALAHDIGLLMAAVDPLARVARYSDVRGTDTAAVGRVLAGIITRVAVGLGPAASNLDDDGAQELRDGIDAVTRGLGMLDEHPSVAEWRAALAGLGRRPGVHGLVAGRVNRLLLDAGQITPTDAADRLWRALSAQSDAAVGAAWVEGFVAGEALLLLHDPDLLAVINGWIDGISDSGFDDVLPLLRRAFSGFSAPERRLIGERVRRSGAGQWDPQRPGRFASGSAGAGAAGGDLAGAGAGRASDGRASAGRDSAGPGDQEVPTFDRERASWATPLMRELLGLSDGESLVSAEPIGS